MRYEPRGLRDGRRLVLVLVLWAASGCGDPTGPGDLAVQVKSDLLPGYEFTEARVTLLDGITESDATQTIRARTAEHPTYLSGRPVGTFRGVTPSEVLVEVSLLAGESVVLTRTTRARIAPGDGTLLTVLMTRDCRAVSCPSVGDSPIATECLAGACVDRACSPQVPMTCPVPRCSRDSDCPDRGIECARARCVEDRCMLAADESLCGSGQRCDLDTGCVGAAPPADAGVLDDAG